jgi:hypothetical protein
MCPDGTEWWEESCECVQQVRLFTSNKAASSLAASSTDKLCSTVALNASVMCASSAVVSPCVAVQMTAEACDKLPY